MEIEKIEIHHENQDIKARHEIELEEILNNGKSSGLLLLIIAPMHV